MNENQENEISNLTHEIQNQSTKNLLLESNLKEMDDQIKKMKQDLNTKEVSLNDANKLNSDLLLEIKELTSN